MKYNNTVQKLWNICDILRDDGINYSEYVTELVLLLFIKMVHETTEAGILKEYPLPEGCRWSDLNKKSGSNLLKTYKSILKVLSTGKCLITDPSNPNYMKEIEVHDSPEIKAIYAGAQTHLREPKHLEQIIKQIDNIDYWFHSNKDGLGELYEGLLEKNANETKSGAGQYFTPRVLINSIVRCIKPQVGQIIQDPAAGTGGFLVSAHEYIKSQTNNFDKLTKKEQLFQQKNAIIGIELVPNTRRLALMNCLLHGIKGEDEGAIILGNALSDTGRNLKQADIILANPPFGTSKGGEASITRDDLEFDTSNKQFLFLQHIYRNLKPGGRAAVVVPDNVLFESGKGTEIRRDLMNKCNLHTILRLPTGIFYAQGVKTNVLFFSKGSPSNKHQKINCTKKVWIYDLRTNMPNFGKRNPFDEAYLLPFEKIYGVNPEGTSPRNEGEWSFGAEDIELDRHGSGNEPLDERMLHSRWRCFSREWIKENKNDSLDIAWLANKIARDLTSRPAPAILANDIKNELIKVLDNIESLIETLGGYTNE